VNTYSFRREHLLLIVLILLAFGLRLFLLSGMEWNYDQRIAWKMAGEMLRGQRWPLVGLDSSVGIPNPPGFVCLVAALRAVTGHPLATTAIIACLNALAVVGFALYFRSRYDAFSVWTAAFLFATTPWAVIFSRSIWAQDLLAPFSVLLLVSLHKAVVERVPPYWLGVAGAAFFLMQLHLSGMCLVVALPLFLGCYRSTDTGRGWRLTAGDRRFVLWGLAGGAVLFTPYVLLILKNADHALDSLRASRIPGYTAWVHGHESLKGMAQILTGMFFETTLLGDTDGYHRFVGAAGHWLPTGVYTVVLVLFGAGLWIVAREWRRHFLNLCALLLVGVHCLYILFLSSRTGGPYFVILYPMLFLILARGFAILRRPVLRTAVVVVIVAVNVWSTLSFQLFIRQNKGTASGYGGLYRAPSEWKGE
jgi:hypothetical protein